MAWRSQMSRRCTAPGTYYLQVPAHSMVNGAASQGPANLLRMCEGAVVRRCEGDRNAMLAIFE